MDVQNFAITDTGQKVTASFGGVDYQLPIIALSCMMFDDNGVFLADYTGVNALIFPLFLASVPFQSESSISLSRLLLDTSADMLRLKYNLENS